MLALRRLAILSAVVLGLELVLGRVLAESDFMSVLAAARHGHVGTSLAFALLLGLRLIAIVMVPPLAVAGVGLVAYERVVARRR
jgi:hypothetical protein